MKTKVYKLRFQIQQIFFANESRTEEKITNDVIFIANLFNYHQRIDKETRFSSTTRRMLRFR